VVLVKKNGTVAKNASAQIGLFTRVSVSKSRRLLSLEKSKRNSIKKLSQKIKMELSKSIKRTLRKTINLFKSKSTQKLVRNLLNKPNQKLIMEI
jgi:RNase P subunit RPR2